MNKHVCPLTACLLLLGVAAQNLFNIGVCGAADTGGKTPMAAKVAELAPAKLTPAERIVALHRFVRDDIRQIDARYG